MPLKLNKKKLDSTYNLKIHISEYIEIKEKGLTLRKISSFGLDKGKWFILQSPHITYL